MRTFSSGLWMSGASAALVLLCGLACACGDDAQASIDPLYVDLSAESGGDGSQKRPLQNMADALELAIPGGLIVVAPGLYEVPSDFTFASDLSVLGSIAAPTRFVGDASEPRIRWQTAAEASLFLRDIAFESALEFSGSSVELNTLSLRGTGPVLSFSESSAKASDLVVTIEQAGAGDYAGDAVVVAQSTLNWERGSAIGANDRALVVEGSTLTLSEVALSGAGRGSMQVLEASEVTASKLSLQDTSMAAFVLGSTLTLVDSSIARSTQPAILVGTGASATVRDSEFADCDAGFIAGSEGSLSLVLERNQFVGSANDNCLTSSSGTIVAKDNTIDTCAGVGILVLGGQDIAISGNLIQNIHYDKLIGITASGIDLNGASGLLRNNTIKATLDAGISITGSVLTVDANTIGPVGGSGISYVGGPADATAVSNNMISEATGAGIIALGATVEMTGNQVASTTLSGEGFADGIVFGSGANVTASSNTLSDNLHNGILFLDGALGTITGNTATGNTEYGVREICVGDANLVTVGTNTLSGNTLGDQTLCSP